MKCHTRKLLKASLITPWMVVPISALFSLYYLCTWIGKPLPDPAVTLIWPNPFKPWESVMLYSLYGVSTAYAALLLIGIDHPVAIDVCAEQQRRGHAAHEQQLFDTLQRTI